MTFSVPETLILIPMMTYQMKFRSAILPWIPFTHLPETPCNLRWLAGGGNNTRHIEHVGLKMWWQGLESLIFPPHHPCYHIPKGCEHPQQWPIISDSQRRISYFQSDNQVSMLLKSFLPEAKEYHRALLSDTHFLTYSPCLLSLTSEHFDIPAGHVICCHLQDSPESFPCS